jgi:quinol monooxygenase YgiN
MWVTTKGIMIMATMLVQHQVSDFAKWKAVYDSVVDMRKSNGELSDKIYRDANNPNNLTIVFKWDSLERAKKYAESPELKEAMQKAGVTGQPKIFFLNEA